jgi:branched-chain amino acid transport system permease protein
MITLAFAQMLYYGANAAVDLGGADGFRLAQRNTLLGTDCLSEPRHFFLIAATILIATLFLARRAMAAMFGAAVQAVRDDVVRADASGIQPFKHLLAVSTLSGGIAAFAGVLAANLDLYVSPSSAFSWHISAEFLIFVIIGSAGTLIGPVIGAALYTILAEILSSHTDHWMLVIGIILLARVLLLKRGVYEALTAWRTT